MTTLATHPVDDPAQLALFADVHTVTRKPLADIFHEACWAEADATDGWVDPNAVRIRVLYAFKRGLVECDEPEMNHRQYSALWSVACGRDGYLDKTDVLVPISGVASRGNGNKSVPMRRWRTS